MTELEEAELTDGQGRALSAHKTKESYAGYLRRSENPPKLGTSFEPTPSAVLRSLR